MKRTTVKLPEILDAALRTEAARRDVTISAITRQALEEHFGGARKLAAVAAGSSGRSDVSARIDEILATEWAGRGE
ncbi:MAG: CopG family transcriptional regulator [Mycobacteriales bacterium]